jgi:hypothetical protein
MNSWKKNNFQGYDCWRKNKGNYFLPNQLLAIVNMPPRTNIFTKRKHETTIFFNIYIYLKKKKKKKRVGWHASHLEMKHEGGSRPPRRPGVACGSGMTCGNLKTWSGRAST